MLDETDNRFCQPFKLIESFQSLDLKKQLAEKDGGSVSAAPSTSTTTSSADIEKLKKEIETKTNEYTEATFRLNLLTSKVQNMEEHKKDLVRKLEDKDKQIQQLEQSLQNRDTMPPTPVSSSVHPIVQSSCRTVPPASQIEIESVNEEPEVSAVVDTVSPPDAGLHLDTDALETDVTPSNIATSSHISPGRQLFGRTGPPHSVGNFKESSSTSTGAVGANTTQDLVSASNSAVEMADDAQNDSESRDSNLNMPVSSTGGSRKRPAGQSIQIEPKRQRETSNEAVSSSEEHMEGRADISRDDEGFIPDPMHADHRDEEEGDDDDIIPLDPPNQANYGYDEDDDDDVEEIHQIDDEDEEEENSDNEEMEEFEVPDSDEGDSEMDNHADDSEDSGDDEGDGVQPPIGELNASDDGEDSTDQNLDADQDVEVIGADDNSRSQPILDEQDREAASAVEEADDEGRVSADGGVPNEAVQASTSNAPRVRVPITFSSDDQCSSSNETGVAAQQGSRGLNLARRGNLPRPTRGVYDPRRKNAQANRSAQNLLNLAPEEDELFDATDFEPPNGMRNTSGGWLTRFLDNFLVWQSSSDEYLERWKKEFKVRPSWADADLCLQQIKRGKATGNQWALYSRSFIQKILFSLGNCVSRNAWKVILSVIVLFSFCLYGLQFVRIETDIVKLWVARGGRLEAELNFLPEVQKLYNNSEGHEMVRENGLGGGYQVIIQTPEFEGQNALSLEGLLKHVDIMKEIASFPVEIHGTNWTFNDICFKPSPPLGDDPVAKGFEHIIERIVPCIWITPIDCFWEGGKALGPHPPVTKKDIGFFGSMIKSLPESNHVKWTNFDPIGVVNEIHKSFSLGAHHSFFERAGIGRGYLDRPCMDPLDPECPTLAPNYYNVCPLLDKFLEYTQKNSIAVEYGGDEEDESDGFDLFDMFGRKKRDTGVADPVGATTTAPPAAGTNGAKSDDEMKLEKEAQEKAAQCKKLRSGMMKWMSVHKEKWPEFLQTTEYPSYPDFGYIMRNGCPGFASEVLHWPSDMILGGTKRDNLDRLSHADALQSVFLVASPNDVYLRYKDRINMTEAKKDKYKSARDMPFWNETIAQEVIQTWQRNFTRRMYNHHHNFDVEGNIRRTIHPLASTSIADMLEEFCQFNFKIIFIGYGLMLVYAMFTQYKHEQFMPSADSCMGLALVGVLTVTFASTSGLGLATWFGIEFNAATTQIVPFLTLGIGVDNMFMLLHNYHEVLLLSNRHEIGILMRETGMSILCTSINNILSFLAGTLLPIPALRSFCAQSSILLTFNFIAILTMYPAMIAIDLRRRKAGRRDICCCLYGDTREEEYSMIQKLQPQQKRTIGETDNTTSLPLFRPVVDDRKSKTPWTLHQVIKRFYIPLLHKRWFRIFVTVGSMLLLFASVKGMQNAAIGLELSDVLPEQTAPAKFLQARDKYFSFYPMFAVLKGPNIDYAKQQHQIENYRRAISSSKFIIKTATDEPSEKYWLQMMRDWLLSIQKVYDDALNDGKINVDGNITGNISDDAKIGLRLICSHGNIYDCSGRIGKVKLVDKSGTINYDGFYNYLTAWFNQENMMYYVSQASFYPAPPAWSLSDKDEVVPPAEPLAYSQIPFYLTGLTDTPIVIEMIKDIRSVCDKYSAQGLPNFPQGIAFTFWEQYLTLNENLMQAIGIIALAVFVVISVLLFNPWAAFSVLVIVLAMTIELAGFLGWAGIKMNPVSAVTLITAVGIGVEFTVHVVLAYLTALGSRRERTSAAVDRVFVPVIHGAFSTLLGIIMLGFSEFEFVKKYFFYVMFALIVIGVINGLILLPVLLSLLGPPQEIHPNPEDCRDGVVRLALPPPIKSRRKRNPLPREEEEEDNSSGLLMRPAAGDYVCFSS